MFVMLLSIFLNYLAGLLIHKYKNQNRISFVVLGVAVILNLAILFYYKYFNFFIEILNSVGLTVEQDNTSIILPIGISFYTFQNLTYLVDIYREEARLQRNPFDLALYISLFPQLIAGPIVRYHDIDKQITERTSTWDKFYSGIIRFTLGLGKKVLIANSMATIADDVFSLPADSISTPIAWIGIICYSLQIYFDFSGYSDMAIGLGRMFGFEFLENFNFPYIAKSIQDFWRRWHISLSSFFKDYVYIPLGGNRVSDVLTYRNLLFVFFLTGLWHGASWNFIFWGFFHGFFIINERLWLGKILKNTVNPVRHFYTLLVVMIGWVFFRSVDIAYAIGYIKTMFSFTVKGNYLPLVNFDNYTLLILIAGIVFSTPISSYVRKRIAISGKLESTLVYSVSMGIFILCIIELARNSYNPFIYFRF